MNTIILLPLCAKAKRHFPKPPLALIYGAALRFPFTSGRVFSWDAGVNLDRFVPRVKAPGKDVAMPSPPRLEGDVVALKDWATTSGRTRAKQKKNGRLGSRMIRPQQGPPLSEGRFGVA